MLFSVEGEIRSGCLMAGNWQANPDMLQGAHMCFRRGLRTIFCRLLALMEN